MPKYTLVIAQSSVVSLEAPSLDALDKALDGVMLNDIIEYLDADPDNWEVETQIKEGFDDIPVELRLVEQDGEMVLKRVPQEHDDGSGA